MRKLLRVFLNLITFGIPLLVSAVGKVKKFNSIINHYVDVKLVLHSEGVDPQSGKCHCSVILTGSQLDLTLEVDSISHVSGSEICNLKEVL